MASHIEALILLDKLEHIEKWTRFAALARVRKLREEKACRGEIEITDLFLATPRCETVNKISTMAYPGELEELTYEEIVRIIKKNIQQKLTSCRWENQIHEDKTNVRRLMEASEYCEELGRKDMSTENELILQIDRRYAGQIEQTKRLQLSYMNSEARQEFLPLELIKEFNKPKDYQ